MFFCVLSNRNFVALLYQFSLYLFVKPFFMSTQSINRDSGRYNISTGFKKNELSAIANNTKTKLVQFSAPLTYEEYDLLEKMVFATRPDIELRIFGHYSVECDLTFLERIPSLRKVTADCMRDTTGIEVVTQLRNLESLCVGIFDLDNFNFLEQVAPNLKVLGLYQTRSKKPKIESIARFENLEYLFLEEQQKGINAIKNLKKLQKIILRSITTTDIDFLQGLKQLWSVDIKLGGIKSFDALKTLPSLKFLELWQIRGLADLSFISDLTTLQNLFIQSLKQVKTLPDFSKNKFLRRIYLENMKGLDDFSTLKHIPNLKEFIICDENKEPDNFLPLFENPTVERVAGFLGSNKRNNRFMDLVNYYQKNIYEYSDFEYQ